MKFNIVPLPLGGGGGAGGVPPGGIGLGPFAIGGGGGGNDAGAGGGGARGGFIDGAPAGSPCGRGGGGAWGGGGKGLGGTPGAAVPFAAGADGGLPISGGFVLKYTCSVNILESGSQCEKNLGVDLSISVLGTLKAIISYGSAANRRYWYLLSYGWTFCS